MFVNRLILLTVPLARTINGSSILGVLLSLRWVQSDAMHCFCKQALELGLELESLVWGWAKWTHMHTTKKNVSLLSKQVKSLYLKSLIYS